LKSDNVQIDELRSWVDQAARVVVLTGAGISTESGIPDFRGPQGLWTKNPQAEKLSNIHYYMADPEVRKAAWISRLEHPAWSAKPNAGHLALAALEKRGKLHALITQNIDELHQMAGNSPDKVIEVHGTVRKVVCMACGMTAPMQKALDRVRAGEEDPPCRDCGGIGTVYTSMCGTLVRVEIERTTGALRIAKAYSVLECGQALVPEVIERALRSAGEADVFFAIGTSLQVFPIAGAVELASAAGAKIVILNAEPTPFDEIADAVFREPIGTTLPQLLRSVPL